MNCICQVAKIKSIHLHLYSACIIYVINTQLKHARFRLQGSRFGFACCVCECCFLLLFFSFVVSNDLGQIQGSKTNPGSLNRNKAFKIAANGLATRRILNFAGVASEIMEFGFSMDGGDSFLTKKLRDPKEFYSTANAKLGSVMLSIPQAAAPCAKKVYRKCHV